jgi:hypothetical protein
MAGLPKESLAWLDQLELLRAQPASASRAELQNILKVKNSHISNLRILTCFDPKAVVKVRQAANQMPSYTLSSNSALALAELKKSSVHSTDAFHAALDFTLSRRLATKHIKALVVWLASGKPVETFDPSQVKAIRPPKRHTNENPQKLSDDDSDFEDRPTTDKEKLKIFLMFIFVFTVLGLFGWLIWKVVFWVIHLF